MNKIINENKINLGNCWKIAPGEQAKDWTNQYNQNVIAIEWNDTGDLSGLTEKEIHQRILDKFPSSIGSVGTQFKNFFKIKKGDVIIANKGKSRIVGLGEVIGNYQYLPDQKYAHTHPVNWFWSGECEIQPQNNWSITVVPVTRESFDFISKDFTQDMNFQIELNSKDSHKQGVENNSEYLRHVQILKRKKNIILYGPPGTGKTYAANKIAKIITNPNDSTKFTNSNRSKHEWRPAIISILIENFGKPMHNSEIERKIMKEDLVETKSQNRCVTLITSVTDDIKKYENKSYFSKQTKGSGMCGLNIPMTFKKAANMILFAYSKPMKSVEIARIAHDKKLIDHSSGIPNEKIENEMIQDINKNGDKSTFVKNSGGMFELRNPPSNRENTEQNHSTNNNKDLIEIVTFHQSYGYEEFIEGIRPELAGNNITYPVKPGIFQKFCQTASKNPKTDYVMIIDEINRGNISNIFGELITIIEKDKRDKKIKLAYSQKDFRVPPNIHIIGTMNTADQSLTHMDAALKRRFSLIEIMPDSSILKNHHLRIPLDKLLEKLNDKIIVRGSREWQIGHSYFMDNEKPISSIEDLQFVFEVDIIPLLRDYFYDNEVALKEILGEQFIEWDDPHRNMKKDWQDHENDFCDAIKSAFGIQIDF